MIGVKVGTNMSNVSRVTWRAVAGIGNEEDKDHQPARRMTTNTKLLRQVREMGGAHYNIK